MRNGAKTLESLFRLSRESIADFATILREMDNEKGGGGGKPRKERLISRPESISTRRND